MVLKFAVQLGNLVTIPVIMLTARGEVMDRVVGLEIGADDYLPKPYELDELVARIHVVLKGWARAASLEEASPLSQT